MRGIGVIFLILYGVLSGGAVDPSDVDFNGDLTIDSLDLFPLFDAWMSHDGTSEDWNVACDISHPPDGIIDVRDLATLTVDWGVRIPEPNAFINPADFNADHNIDVGDIITFSSAWLSEDTPTANWNAACDIASPLDGMINGRDYVVFASQWRAAVPDPNDYVNVPDINHDRVVDLWDYTLVSGVWLSNDEPPVNWNRACDIAEPKDGIINVRDFAALSKNWCFVIPDPNLFAFIPGGEFEMGAHLDPIYAAKPVHTVRLDSFYMCRFQMTNQRYCNFLNSVLLLGMIKIEEGIVYAADDADNSQPWCDTHQSNANSQIDYLNGQFSVRPKDGVTDMIHHPVVQVNWYGAVACCNWKSLQEGRTPCYDLSTWECDFTADGYRLPTEAEWEYAARGGMPGQRYPWGNTIDGSMANFEDSGDPFEDPNNIMSFPYTAPVGYYNGNQTPAGVDMANGYNLYDMAGNVYEWCYDWFGESYYQQCYDQGAVTNPTGPAAGTTRVLRGGSWNIAAETRICQVDYRDDNTSHLPGALSGSYGFRICLPAP